MAKDTLYVEADDEITAVIDKLTSAKNKIVAIVLPKRATVFQSAVNMKLLKRAAQDAHKSLVIISSEESIRSIAAVAGVHVAQTLNSKPEIPKKSVAALSETTIGADELEDMDMASEDATPTTAASQAAAVASEAKASEAKKGSERTSSASSDSGSKKSSSSPKSSRSSEDTISMDDEEDAAAGATAAAEGAKDAAKVKKPKFKIPDFGNFRVRLIAGVLLVVLLSTAWVYGFVIAPEATVTISADTTRSTISYQFTADAAVEEVDLEQRVVPATIEEVTKQNKVTIETTGQKNIGEKATGKVTITNCSSSAYTVDAGDQFTSGGSTFVANAAASIPKSSYSFTVNGFECDEDGKKAIDVTAKEAGSGYNIGEGSYSVAGSPNNVTAFGSAMKGGTDEIVKVVSADDIKNAAAQLKGGSSAEASTELQNKLTERQLTPLVQTLEEGEPTQKNSKAEGEEATEITVEQTIVYKMLGVSNEDMVSLLDAQIAAQLTEENQDKNVRDNGLANLALRVVNKPSTERQIIGAETIATLGPEFDTEAIAKDVAGKKRGDIEKMLEARDSVRSVKVEYSPRWVTTTPKKAEKINIVIDEVEN